MALDGKTIKEEISDKEPYEATNLRQKNNKAKDTCDTPGSPETARVIAPRSPISPQLHPTNLVTPSPQLKNSQIINKNGSLSPLNFRNAETPPPSIGAASITNSTIHAQDQTRALIKTKRFFGALIQFGQESCQDNGDKVRALILSLASGCLTADEFKLALQEATNFPVRQNVLPFLRSHIPILQREISNLARKCNQTPLQYVRTNEHCVIELNNNVHETSEIFLPLDNGTPSSNNNSSGIPSLQTSQIFCKRRPSENFLENHNGGNDWNDLIPAKRPYHPMINSSSHPSYPNHSQYLEYQNSSHLHSDSGGGYINADKTNNIPREERDMRMVSQSADAYRRDRDRQSANEDEWKNIHTMLSCISAMVEKTKRAITILQQRSSDGPISSQDATIAEIKRQTEERVAEFKRNAEEAVNQVKRQAVIEIQRAVSAAENRTIEIMAQERLKMDKFFSEISKSSSESVGDGHSSQSPLIPGLQNTCWNCGRTANETCSGCNSARYCNALCQHKDWDQHLKVCGTTRAELGMPKTLQINVKPPVRLSPITSQQSTPPQPPLQQPPPQSQTPVTNGVIACSIK